MVVMVVRNLGFLGKQNGKDACKFNKATQAMADGPQRCLGAGMPVKLLSVSGM
jgi:hypothetical protein